MIHKILTRDFALVCFAHFAFSLVFALLIPTLPIYLSRLGSTEAEIGVLIGTFFFSSVVLRPFVGGTLLRISERTIMSIGSLLFALTSLAYLLAAPFWPFLIVRVFQGIGFAFFHTAAYTLVANISPRGNLGEAISYIYMVFNLSGALGPLIGMFLVNHSSFTVLFLVCVGLSLCSLLAVNKLGRRQAALLSDPPIGGGFFLSWKAIPPSIVSFFCLFIWGGIAAFFPLHAINHGVANPGLFFATVATMLILGRAFGARILDLYGKERIILPCLFGYIISVGILAYSKTLPMFILVAIIYGAGHAFLGPTLLAYALDRADSSRSPVIGTFTALSDLGMSLGPVIMGIIIRSTNYFTMFLCLVLTGLINLNYFYFFVRKQRN
jgi:MFS family permease